MTEGTDLSAGRAAAARADWANAYQSFTGADEHVPLAAHDLELWATSAYMLGSQDDYEALLDRAHQRYLDHGDAHKAAYCACWLALSLAGNGARSQAEGWFARGRRLVADLEEEGAVHGLLELGSALAAVGERRFDDAFAHADRALATGLRFHDDDLSALALQVMGRIELQRGNTSNGLRHLDEAMVAVTSGALLPPVAGIVYCSVIDGCRTVHALDRAHEWTDALARWCEKQPEMIAFNGECRVLRAEMLQFRGAWQDALAEADRAGERLTPWSARRVTAAAHYQRGEVARLRGEFDVAAREYGAAALAGASPQPGLALLRLAQGDVEQAARGLAGALAEATDPGRRARLLPAAVEVALADLRLEDAGTAAAELSVLASTFGAPALAVVADHAAAAVALAAGDIERATATLRTVVTAWLDMSSPYLAARAQVLLGLAHRSLGDQDGAASSFAAARASFEELEAGPDLAALTRLFGDEAPFGLTPREREVLAGLATGDTNRVIGERLGISDRTVDRHVSNVFDKLGVTSRAEAVALAVRHRLA